MPARFMREMSKLASPKFYSEMYMSYMTSYAKKYLHTGSGAPVVHGILLIGGAGYMIDWFTKEIYHVRRKQEALARGMAQMDSEHH